MVSVEEKNKNRRYGLVLVIKQFTMQHTVNESNTGRNFELKKNCQSSLIIGHSFHFKDTIQQNITYFKTKTPLNSNKTIKINE